MARPAKLIETQSRHNTKNEVEKRKKAEEMLRGTGTSSPPYPLSNNQLDIFNRIKFVYEDTNLLGELDGFILAEAAVVIDRLQQLEQMINNNSSLLLDNDVMRIRKEYTQNFFRICNELSLSPQSRAKIGSIALSKNEEKNDVLLKILKGDSS